MKLKLIITILPLFYSRSIHKRNADYPQYQNYQNYPAQQQKYSQNQQYNNQYNNNFGQQYWIDESFY